MITVNVALTVLVVLLAALCLCRLISLTSRNEESTHGGGIDQSTW